MSIHWIDMIERIRNDLPSRSARYPNTTSPGATPTAVTTSRQRDRPQTNKKTPDKLFQACRAFNLSNRDRYGWRIAPPPDEQSSPGMCWPYPRWGQPKLSSSGLGIPRKEVIQPQVPLRLPCYDLVPVTGLTVGRRLTKLTNGLRVLPASMTW